MQGPLVWWAEEFGRGRGVEAPAAKVMLHVSQLQRSGVSAEVTGRVADTVQTRRAVGPTDHR